MSLPGRVPSKILLVVELSYVNMFDSNSTLERTWYLFSVAEANGDLVPLFPTNHGSLR